MSKSIQIRTYHPAESAVFSKTKERFGGLSNMAAGFPLIVNRVRIRTSEALYQACRFPHKPDVQHQIINVPSPMTAKMRSKPFRKDTRPDWDTERVRIMRWCLRVKLAQNWGKFEELLLLTDNIPIVEQSRKDDFWGAKITEDGLLIGMNVLGRLLMELREQLMGDNTENLRFIKPLNIPEFFLYQHPIQPICADDEACASQSAVQSATLLRDQPMKLQDQMEFQLEYISVEANNNMKPSPYPVYRDSGEPWLDQVPEHWEVRRNKYVFREIDKRSVTGEEPQLSVSQIHGLINSSKIDTWRLRSQSYLGGKLCEIGDLVLNRLKAHLGVFAYASASGVISPDYTIFRPLDGVEARYFEHLYKSPWYRTELRKRTKGIVEGFWRLYTDDFFDLKAVVPTKMEQTKIISFIEAYDCRVTRLIRNKRRLIELYNEQKQAIINQVITRGLNPDAPMKSTGIDWMPEVPAHWEVKRLKVLVRNIIEQTHSLRDGDIYIALEHVRSWTGEVVPPISATTFDSQVKRFEAGDVLFGKLRPYLAKVARPDRAGVCVGEFLVLRSTATASINTDFLEQRLRSKRFIDIVNSSTFGAKMPRAEWGFIGNLKIAYPPDPKEQNRLLNFILDKTTALDSAISRAEHEISLVNEYRERLIADVVTGKLDVRHIEISALAAELTANDNEMEEKLEHNGAGMMEETNANH